MTYQFKHLALGGTFDFLHKGHKQFLDFAFKKAAFVSVGVTTDEFIKTRGKINVRPFKLRLAELDEYLGEKNYKIRSKIILLDNIFGSTISDKTIDSLLVTDITIKGASLINQKRKADALLPLEIVRFPLVKAEDKGPISSGRIKFGDIDREGNVYFLKIKGKDYFMGGNLRRELARPHGILYNNVVELVAENRNLKGELISVGDQTTMNFLKKRIVPQLSIVDLKIRRKKVFNSILELGFDSFQEFETVSNPASSLKKQLIDCLKDYFRGKIHGGWVIKIDGEEDLAVLPTVILAPLGWKVAYGQPNEGVVLIEVSEQTKRDFLDIIAKFKSI